MRWFALATALLALAPISRSARAQGNYRSAPTGGRSALMGNTGIALGTDGAAPFLNPATVVHVDSSLALTLNFVSIDTWHVANYYVPGPVDTATYGNVPTSSSSDITRVAGNAVPSTFCVFAGLPRIGSAKEGHAGEQKLAACLGATERQFFDWVGQGYQANSPDRATTQANSVRRGWQRFVVAPSWAVNVTDSLALGASIHGTFTDYNSLVSVGTTTSGGTLPATASVFQAGASGSDFGLSALIGATLTLGRVTLGASVQSPDVSLYGHGNINSYVQFASAANVSSTTYLGSGSFHADEPTRFSLGAGYQWSTGTVELDLQLALAQNDAVRLDTSGTQLQTPAVASIPTTLSLATRYEPTVNVGVGGELYVRPSLSLLGGFGTDLSSVSTIGPTTTAQSRIDRLFWAFGVGTHGTGGTLLIGAQVYYGWGSTLAPNVYQPVPVLQPTGMSSFGVLFVLAGATSLKAIEQAVTDVKRAIVPNK